MFLFCIHLYEPKKLKTNLHFPLSLAQHDVYCDHTRQQDRWFSNIGGYIRLDTIDEPRMAQAHHALIESEDVFSLRIHVASERAQQHISDDVETTLPLVDVSEAIDPIAEADRWTAEQFESVFELKNNALYRTALLKLSDSSYRYVFIAHRLILDNRGLSNIAKKLAGFYNQVPVTSEAAISWNEVVADDSHYTTSNKYQADADYWLSQEGICNDQFIGSPHQFSLPALQVRQSQRHVVSIQESLSGEIGALAVRFDCSVAQLYLSIVAAYCSLIYETKQVRVGLSVHNRIEPTYQSILGVFANISPLVISVEEASSFATLLDKIVCLQKESARHQRYPLSHLVQALSEQGFVGKPYDVVFNYLTTDAELDFDKSHGELVYLSHDNDSEPLKFTVWECPETGGAEIQIDYALKSFTPFEAKQTGQRLLGLLTQIVRNPECELFKYQRLPEDEVSQLLRWTRPQNCEKLVHQRIEDQVRISKDAIAVRFRDESLSYEELNGKANRLARVLRELGVGPNSKVGVCLERNQDLVVSLLAILKAGAAYVPLDHSYPKKRLSHILNDSEIGCVLTQEEVLHVIPSDSIHQLLVCEIISGDVTSEDLVNLTSANRGGLDAAYVIYTSGSTGQPKAVELCHANVDALLEWSVKEFGLTRLARVLASTSINFDLSVFEIFAPLSIGGECVLVYNILELADRQIDVTLINTVPSAAKLLVQHDLVSNSVNTINVAGEPLSQSLLNELVSHKNVERVYNLYGPSEDTVYSTYKSFTESTSTLPTIGTPIDGTHCYVVSKSGRLCPDGIEGELYLTGAGVGLGYSNKPELTAMCFIKDTFAPDNSYMVYKTGDRVRRLESGELSFLGRNDQQVKIRGFRIELGEIENILNQDSRVNESLVLIADGEGDPQLCALVTQTNEEYDLSEKLMALLRDWLPIHMVPDSITVLDEFPLNVNGKIDKRALVSQLEERR